MATAVVRDRWQVTIPVDMREDWLEPGSVVIWEKEDDKLVVRSYHDKKKPDWDRIWAGIRRARSFKSRGKEMPLSEYIIREREKRRV